MTDATPPDRAATIERVLGDPLMQAMEALRAATWRLVWWPWSVRRHRAVLLALEEVMVLHVNRVVGTSGAAVIGPLERVQTDEERIHVHLGRIEERLTRIERQLANRSREVGGAGHEHPAAQ